MLAVAWLTVCLGLSGALSSRPFVLSLLALTLWCLLPGVASELLIGTTGGPLLMQPAASFAVIAFLGQLVVNPSATVRALTHRLEWTILLTCVVTVAFTLGITSHNGPSAIYTTVDQIVGPVALFFLLGASILSEPSRVEGLRWWFLAMATAQSLLALAQEALGRTIFYERFFATQYWFLDTFRRWMGTLDHPLVLSLMLTIAIPLVAGVRHRWLLFVLPTLFMAGIVTAQSRVGVLIGALGIIYVAVRGPLGSAGKVAYLALMGALVALAAGTGAFSNVLERVADDSGSADARAIAITYFMKHVGQYVWMGGGLDSSFQVSDALGLDTSFENAFMMYVIDLGLVVAIMYLAVMVMASARAFRRNAPPGLAGAAIAALIVPETFSALSGSTAAPAMVWAVFAMTGFFVVSRTPRALPLALHPVLGAPAPALGARRASSPIGGGLVESATTPASPARADGTEWPT